ncbi:MAG: CHASE2 domain-containing protein, partial [Spirulinaceae cyanobacterium]
VKVARERLQNVDLSYQNSDGDTVYFNYPCATWLPAICENPAAIPPSWQELVVKNKNKISLSFKRSLRFVLIASLIITTIIFWGRWQGHLEPLELRAYDYLMQQLPLLPPDERIVVIGVTPDDLDYLGQPLEERGGGARTLSDRSLDRVMAKLQVLDPAVIGLNLAIQGDIDSEFSNLEAALKSNNFVGTCQNSRATYPGLTVPPEVTAERVGYDQPVQDIDGVIRRHFLWMEVSDRFPCKGNKVVSFPFRVATKYLEKQGYSYNVTPGESIQFSNSEVLPSSIILKSATNHYGGYNQNIDIPVIQNEIQVLVNYRPYHNFKQDIVSFRTLRELLEGQLTRDRIQNKIVLVGKIIGTEDLNLTPFSQSITEQLPGVLLNAQRISDLISVVKQERPLIGVWSWWQDGLFLWPWSLIGASIPWINFQFLKSQRKVILAKLILVSSIVFCLYILCSFFFAQGFWLPFVPALLTFFLGLGTTTVYKIIKKQKSFRSSETNLTPKPLNYYD